MVYPVSSPLQQSVPASNTFQPGGTENQRKAQEDRAPDTTKLSGTETARSEKTSNRNTDSTERLASDSRYEDNGSVSTSSARGTQLDVTA
jgi:hypothetical protein